MNERFDCSTIPVFFETANPDHVEIYRQKGFSVFKKVDKDGITIYFMQR
jgi:hypothetical protein